MRWMIALITGLLSMALWGCAGQGKGNLGSSPLQSSSPQSSPPAATENPVASSAADANSSSGPGPSSSGSASAVSVVYSAQAPAAFVSPSGNIACYFYDRSVRCDIKEKSFKLPPKPSFCETDYGHAIVLGTKVEVACAGDTIMYEPAIGGAAAAWFSGQPLRIPGQSGSFAVLRYGETLKVGDVSWQSNQAGVGCKNAEAGIGFHLSRSAYSLAP